MSLNDEQLQAMRSQMSCGFQQLDTAFAGCMEDATARLSEEGMAEYMAGAKRLCSIGRGWEPVLTFLEEMPTVATIVGEDVIKLVSDTIWDFSRTPNGKAIPAFLQTIPEASRRLQTQEQLKHYFDLVFEMMEITTASIHGHHKTFPSPGLPVMLDNMPYLLANLSLKGLKNWITYGVRYYLDHPERQIDYFSLQSADSRAIMSKERHGTLLVDNERKLDLFLKAMWDSRDTYMPYSTGFSELRKPIPYYDDLGIRVPDVYDDVESRLGYTVSGLDRYRALLAHVAAHKKWTTAIFADNFSPFQRVATEICEDLRVEILAIREYPGLRELFLSLHPKPVEDACDPEEQSCIRHRLAMFSYAVLDDDHGYNNSDLIEFVGRFHDAMADGAESSTQDIAKVAVSYIARTRTQGDQSPNIYFDDTEVNYRDDNRHMWKYHELSDDEEMFEEENKSSAEDGEEEDVGLPPRHYPEWDYTSTSYRPDWTSVYERVHPSGDPQIIDDLLEKNAILAKQLKAVLDRLKPQQYKRLRYQEEGSDLDLDVAIRSLIDFKSGSQPDPRINMSHTTDGRDIAVMLLIDLSQSVGDRPQGCEQTVLELSQEAVALLAWAVDHLGDKFAIAGFSSNTRHEVRYEHIKGYNEGWDDTVKSRLAAIEPGYSTRMGAAMRHAGHTLSNRKADKKVLLVLTDGEPADIDVDDERHLIEDARKAVQELDREGVYSYCINLDAQADEYVQDIFGQQYSVIDKVERLPEKLPKLFMALTK